MQLFFSICLSPEIWLFNCIVVKGEPWLTARSYCWMISPLLWVLASLRSHYSSNFINNWVFISAENIMYCGKEMNCKSKFIHWLVYIMESDCMGEEMDEKHSLVMSIPINAYLFQMLLRLSGHSSVNKFKIVLRFSSFIKLEGLYERIKRDRREKLNIDPNVNLEKHLWFSITHSVWTFYSWSLSIIFF